jgi:DNA excision repair protein ERCC-2
VLTDEAHNLVDRARQMYTATLDQREFSGMRQGAPAALKKPVDAVHRSWNTLVRDQTEPYVAHDDAPGKLVLALQKLTAALNDHFADSPAGPDSGLHRWYFDALHFLRVAELHGAHAMFDITLDGGDAVGSRRARGSVLCLRNVVPGPLLRDRWLAAHSVTLFSATLHPARYHLDMLGLPDNTVCVDVPTPFAQSQLEVQVTRHISTRYADRQRSLGRVVEAMAAQFTRQPGNYLAFFSSFDYLQMAADRFCAEHPHVPVWLQSRRMGETDRTGFVARFAPGGSGIGFAVLGGAFGEGIDLPGSRLIGAFVATLGLPQVNPVNEQFRQRVDASVGHGHDYTYLIPGLQKVVQAAGRVIRTLDDRGTVVLMDDRFARAEVRRLLPGWWQVSDHPARLAPAVAESE